MRTSTRNGVWYVWAPPTDSNSSSRQTALRPPLIVSPEKMTLPVGPVTLKAVPVGRERSESTQAVTCVDQCAVKVPPGVEDTR
jgi:hypothetical protein